MAPKITPDEDTRPECRNVGSWIVNSLGYVHKFLQTRVALYYVWSRELVSYSLKDDAVFLLQNKDEVA